MCILVLLKARGLLNRIKIILYRVDIDKTSILVINLESLPLYIKCLIEPYKIYKDNT